MNIVAELDSHYRWLAEKPDNWDEEGAEKFAPETLQASRKLAEELGLKVDADEISANPYTKGSIDVSIKKGNKSILLNTTKDLQTSFYGNRESDDGDAVRGMIEGQRSIDEIVEWFKK